MPSSKIFILLQSLSKKELKRLQDFLESPYFNKSALLVKLFGYLRKYHPEFQHPKLSKQSIHKFLQPDKKFNSKFVNDRFSDLSKLIERFLKISYLEQEGEGRDSILQLASFQERGLNELFEKNSLKKIKTIEESTTVSRKEIQNLWELYHQFYFRPAINLKLNGKDYLKGAMGNLDLYYVLLKLSYSCDLISRGITYSEQQEIPFLNSLLSNLNQLELQHPLLKIYGPLLELFKDGFNPVSFEKLIQEYRQSYYLMGQFEKTTLLLKLIGIAHREYLSGDLVQIENCFQLYKFGIEKEVVLTEKLASGFTFLNVVTTGAITKNFNWIEKFIEDKKGLLEKSQKETTLQLSKAYILFYQNNFNEAHEITHLILSNSATHKLRIKSLMIRCLYEMYKAEYSYKSVLFAGMEAFGRFLSRDQKYSQSRITAYQNFIIAIKNLCQIIPLKDDQSIKKKIDIADKIKKLQPIFALPWLLSKLEEF